MRQPANQRLTALERGLILCLVLMAVPTAGHAAGRATTFNTNGVTAFDSWIDLSNPADPVEGSIYIYATGSAAQPAYQLIYEVNDFDLTLFNTGQGAIPGASVSFSGGSLTNGNAVVSLSVNTCQLDPAVFFTISGACGTINVTWTEVPGNSINPAGFTSTVRGSRDVISGNVTQHIAGTIETANALARGTVIGSNLSTTTFQVTVGLTKNVTVVIQSP